MTAVAMLASGQPPLILASQSRARQDILAGAGMAFDAMPAALDERAIEQESGLTAPAAVAERLAGAKAVSISMQHPDRYVIGADQTLALGERRFSKPTNRGQAAEQLQVLAGQTHQLHSAVAVARGGKMLFADVAVAHMTMRALDAQAIEAYLDAAGDAVMTSVGAYQLERLGVHLFARIDGDHFTILGLPLLPLLAFLRQERVLAF